MLTPGSPGWAARPGMTTEVTLTYCATSGKLDALGAHAWNLTEPIEQPRVETGKRRVPIAGLPAVEVDQQDIFTVKADVDRIQIRKCSYKQPRANHQEQGDRNLQRDQRLAQPWTEAAARGIRT